MCKTTKIEISFPTGVDFPDGFEQTLDSLIDMVCRHYEHDNPTRVMWPSGSGGMPLGNIMNENVDYDMSVLCIDVAEREDTSGRNPLNPNKEELQEKIRVESAKRRARKNNRPVV